MAPNGDSAATPSSPPPAPHQAPAAQQPTATLWEQLVLSRFAKADVRQPFEWSSVRTGAIVGATSGAIVALGLTATRRTDRPLSTTLPKLAATWAMLGATFAGFRELVSTNPSNGPVTSTFIASTAIGIFHAGLRWTPLPPAQALSRVALAATIPAAIHWTALASQKWQHEYTLKQIYEQELERQREAAGLPKPVPWYDKLQVRTLSPDEKMERLLAKVKAYEARLKAEEERKEAAERQAQQKKQDR
ncbi:hypothetical protein CAOG_06271 [Capsaspora owczarzaki ATCC 30864]|nr:hypothetical protein CAOG_06271 [Capsaspora owczarzaki ATCC 30864]|eukprot:XP_004345020.1 hypothetical protein CAOG_06271 [Capsaspora owczarzaki ATCC 30864]